MLEKKCFNCALGTLFPDGTLRCFDLSLARNPCGEHKFGKPSLYKIGRTVFIKQQRVEVTVKPIKKQWRLF